SADMAPSEYSTPSRRASASGSTRIWSLTARVPTLRRGAQNRSQGAAKASGCSRSSSRFPLSWAPYFRDEFPRCERERQHVGAFGRVRRTKSEEGARTVIAEAVARVLERHLRLRVVQQSREPCALDGPMCFEFRPEGGTIAEGPDANKVIGLGITAPVDVNGVAPKARDFRFCKFVIFPLLVKIMFDQFEVARRLLRVSPLFLPRQVAHPQPSSFEIEDIKLT